MTTSGVNTLSVTRDEIINMAFEDMGVYAPGMEAPEPGEISTAAVRLNMMLKAWQAANVGLWLHQTATLPLAAAAQSYNLGPTGANCSTLMGEAALAVAAVTADLTITVDDDTGITNGQYIGIEQDDDTIHWTTVNGVPVANVVTLTAGMVEDAAIGSVVYFYTNKISRPLSIVEARISDVDGNETPLTVLSRNEYLTLPLKSAEGRTNSYYYDPQLTNGILSVWPVNTVLSDKIIFTFRVPVQVFVNLNDTPDFPYEWFDALHYNLALRLCSAFTVPPQRRAEIKEMAAITLQDADGFDREQEVSIQIVPGYEGWE